MTTPTHEDLAGLPPVQRALAAVKHELSHHPDGKINKTLVTPGLLQIVKQRGLIDHFLMVDVKAGEPLPVDQVKLKLTADGDTHLTELEGGTKEAKATKAKPSPG